MSAPIIVKGEIIGADVVELRLKHAGAVVRERLGRIVPALGFELEDQVKHVWLAGRALNKRSGRLQRSINTRTQSSAHTVTATVGTNLKYGVAWERGAHIPAYDIFPKRKQALMWAGAKHPVKHVHMPAREMAARPFLRPALKEMRPEIDRQIRTAAEGL